MSAYFLTYICTLHLLCCLSHNRTQAQNCWTANGTLHRDRNYLFCISLNSLRIKLFRHTLRNKKLCPIWTPRPSSCDLVSVTRRCRILTKFGIGILYDNLLGRGEFRDNWLNENHTLRKDVNEFLHVHPITTLHKKYPFDASEWLRFQWRIPEDVFENFPVFIHCKSELLKSRTEDFHKHLLGYCGFHRNQHS